MMMKGAMMVRVVMMKAAGVRLFGVGVSLIEYIVFDACLWYVLPWV